MAFRLTSPLPRIVVIVVVALLATATLTYAAGQKLASAPAAQSPAPATPPRLQIVVPDLSNQAFVFAKGMLEDAGFAWKVAGGVPGYASNVVAAQSPAPGTHVYDTGAPTITVLLKHGKYAATGAPENVSPYRGTAVQVASTASLPLSPIAGQKVAEKAAPAVKAAPKTAAPKTAAPKKAAPKKATPKAAATYPQSRPVAFQRAGASKEPLDEMPLPDRARLLSTWLAAHPKPSAANVRHFLYQNAWIVTGARFGWWRGAEALKLLVAADRRAEAQWGVGSKSESLARLALAEVEARSK
jgi:hypothetical protein